MTLTWFWREALCLADDNIPLITRPHENKVKWVYLSLGEPTHQIISSTQQSEEALDLDLSVFLEHKPPITLHFNYSTEAPEGIYVTFVFLCPLMQHKLNIYTSIYFTAGKMVSIKLSCLYCRKTKIFLKLVQHEQRKQRKSCVATTNNTLLHPGPLWLVGDVMWVVLFLVLAHLNWKVH